MSPINTFGVLALASSALAVPFAGHANHQHLHKHEARAPQGTYGQASAPPAYGGHSSSAAAAFSFSSSSGASGYAAPSGGWGIGYGTGTGGIPYPTGGWYSWSPKGPGGAASSPAGYSGAASSAVGTSSEATVTAIQTIEVSPSAVPAGWGSGAGGASAAPVEGAQCSADVTITTKVTLTMTVTAGGAPVTTPVFSTSSAAAASSSAVVSSPAAPPAYSSPAAPVSSPAAPPAYSSPAAPVSSPASSPAAPPAYSEPAASPSSPAPAATSGAPPAYSANAQSKASSGGASSGSGAAPFSGGKRGLAYNDASLVTPFIGGSGIGWAYNWVSASAGLAEGIPYVAELHDMSEEFTSVWMEQAQAAIDAGTEYLFGFNEPDIASQANLSPAAAAAGWQTYMQPFAGKAKLVAPAVSNSQTPGQGLSWLQEFMEACSGCTFDAVNQHWYDYTSNDISSLQGQISQAASQSGLPVFVGEFGFIGSSGEISSALEQAMGWMDSQDSVLGYAYYFLDDGLLLDGTSPSSYGATYLG